MRRRHFAALCVVLTGARIGAQEDTATGAEYNPWVETAVEQTETDTSATTGHEETDSSVSTQALGGDVDSSVADTLVAPVPVVGETAAAVDASADTTAGMPEETGSSEPDHGALLAATDSLIAAGAYDSATALLEEVIARDSLAAKAYARLARTAFRRVDYQKCIELSRRAGELGVDPTPEFIYSLGSSYGRTGNYEEALTTFSAYEKSQEGDSLSSLIAAESYYYESKLYEQFARQAVASETALDSVALNDSVVAVLPFTNAGGVEGYEALSKAMADMVITDLSQVQALRVVERTKLAKLYEEMALDQAGLTQDAGRERVARLLRASRVVAGMYRVGDSSTIRIKGGYIVVASEKRVSAEPISGNLERFFELEKQFVFSVIDGMGIVLSEEERKQVQVVKTEDLLALLAYGEGLDARDRGDFAAAGKAFGRAAEIDPSFSEAQQMARAMEVAEDLSSEPVQPKQEEPPAAAEEAEQPEEETMPEEPPVVVDGSGPAMAEPQGAAEEPAATGGLNANSGLGRRMSTIAGASFMPELQVGTSYGPAEDTEGETQAEFHTDSEVDRTRADYADSERLGFGDGSKSVEIVVELPEAQ